MIASIPSEGGHYLSDVLAGAGLAIVAIAVARVILRHDFRSPVPIIAPRLTLNDDRS
jgi:membrane-associated phospholipid phosphatase